MSNDDGGRTKWKSDDLLKFFIDLCVEEANKRNYCGSSLKQESWDKIRKEIKDKKNVDLTHKQVKNQWDYMKRKYQTWVSILGKTGNTSLDPATNKLNWSDEKWEEESKLNPKVKHFKKKPLEYPEEMKALFDGILATGKDAWGPSKEGLPMDGIQAPILVDEKDDVPSSSNVQIKQENKRRKRNSASEKVDVIEDELLTAIKSLQKSDGPTVEECNTVLDAMKTLNMEDPLYIAATCIFCENKAYREQWIKLSEKPEEFRKS